LSCHNSIFNDNPKIKFIDKDFNIHYKPSCENLLELWEIASKCKQVILLPSGSNWTFFHKLHIIKENQLFITNQDYQKKLNNIIQFFNEKENLVNFINI
jgi:hypothetical protein